MTESEVQRLITLEARHWGIKLFRNNVGVATFSGGQKVKYGLQTGSADLIGWIAHPTPDGVIARFLSIEVKKPGESPSKDQAHWAEVVAKDGGLAIIADSIEGFRSCLSKMGYSNTGNS